MPDPATNPPLIHAAESPAATPRFTKHKLAILAAGLVVAMIALTLTDAAIARALFYPEGRDDWWRAAFKLVGDIRFWLAVGAVALAITRDWRWPAALVGAAALAGGLAEFGKLLVGRARPSENFQLVNDGHYSFRPFMADFSADFFSATNLGFPSSHAATAFGGATMLAILVNIKSPPLVWLAFTLATACAASRVFAGAHFATDTLAGAALGYAAAHTIALISDTMSKPKPAAS